MNLPKFLQKQRASHSGCIVDAASAQLSRWVGSHRLGDLSTRREITAGSESGFE
jgi:hypothetical protein